MKKHFFSYLVLVVAVLAGIGCSTQADTGGSPGFRYVVPELLSDGLRVGHLRDVGMNPDRIIDLGNTILDGTYGGVDSVLIIKDDLLVFEAYFGEWSLTSIHDVMSCTKSVVSTAFGIARDQGYWRDTGEFLFDFIPDYGHLRTDANQEIRISHLLKMTAGFEWNQSPPFDSKNNLIQMINADDSIAYILSRPMASPPGTNWGYNGGCTQLLAEIINEVSGMEVNTFVDRHLFHPLGITRFYWKRMADGRPNADFGLHMRSRDMAKIGLLFLNQGVWQGDRILSEEWVRCATTGHEKPFGDLNHSRYGYQWWVNILYSTKHNFNHYSALGNGGQYILVYPDLNMVVVFTQQYYDKTDKAMNMMNMYILGALT